MVGRETEGLMCALPCYWPMSQAELEPEAWVGSPWAPLTSLVGWESVS